jgi:HlyD family secretion protein
MNAPKVQTARNEIDALLGEGAAPHRGRRRLAIAAVLAIVVALAAHWLSGGGAAPAVRYLTEPAARGDLAVLVTATGSVQPTNLVEVSSELSGIVRSVHVDHNSRVVAGQLLAELDTDRLLAVVASARARVTAARVRIAETEALERQADRELARQQSLAAERIASEHDLDAALAEHERSAAAVQTARADFEVAEADLRLAETNLQKARICSPIAGVVLQRNIDPGQTVAASLQAPMLFSIAGNLDQMEVQVDVDEADVGRVAEGQQASFTVDAYPGRRFPAQIRTLRLAPETVQGVVTYKAVLGVDNAERLLRPGMTATAEIVVRELRDALLVPNAALRFRPASESPTAERPGGLGRLMPMPPGFGRSSRREDTGTEREVWVLREDRPVSVAVTTGASDGRRTEIVAGAIEPGDQVVIEAVQRGG